MSIRKPFDGDAGYVCSLRAPFGHVVVYDRSRGADWIDADTRWVVAAYDHDRKNIALLECHSQRAARQTMKAAREGHHDWITQDFNEPDPVDESRPGPVGEPGGTMTTTIATGESITLHLDERGRPLPRFPTNESYMRGWNQGMRPRRPIIRTRK